MQPPRPDILRPLIHAERKLRHLRDRLWRELQLQPFRLQQRRILPHKRRLGLRQNPHEILHRQRLQLHPNRKTPLQLRNQIARLRHMERPRGNEQDEVRPHHPIARVDRRPFHNRQNVPLHPFARNIGSMPALAPRNLVDLVQEDNARALHPFHCQPRYLIHVDQPAFFLLNQVLKSIRHLHLPLPRPLPKDVRQHVLQVDVHLLHALVGDDLERWRIPLPHIDLHHALVQLAFAELLPQLLPRAGVRARL